MYSYLMFVPETDEEKDFLNKIVIEVTKHSSPNQRECLVIDQDNKMYQVSLSFFHEMRNNNINFNTIDITYRELKLLAVKHATGEITLN